MSRDHEKLLKELVAKEVYLTPSRVSDKLKVNVYCAREALRDLLQNEVLKPFYLFHYHHHYFYQGKTFQTFFYLIK